MRMKTYKKRIADKILKWRLECKGAVLIEGAKWCGKTTTAEQIAKSILYMQEPKRRDDNVRLARVDPSLLLNGDVPRLIDEWQIAPQLWDAIRFEVDHREDFGQFILTGSAVPPDKSEIQHSGVGRFTKMTMRPMSLFESGESSGDISLQALFNGEVPSGKSSLDLEQLNFIICRGGWPRAISLSSRAALQQARDYYQLVVESDISRVDGVERNPNLTRRLMRAYARVLATQATIESVTKDISAEMRVSTDTVSSYLEALRKIFVIEDANAWCPNLRAKAPVRTAPTRYFVDPSVAAAALHLGPGDLLNDLNTMGLLLENLCFRDLRVYAELLEGEVYHYRDKTGLECDAVVHLHNGSYGLIEIKLGGDRLVEEGVKTLKKLEARLDTTRMKQPSFLAVVTGVGSYAYRREDGVYVIPIGSLRP